jgi:hypothetical protein
MGEHAAFIAHLLDPQEKTLIDKADQAHQKFAALDAGTPPPPSPSDPVMAAAHEILDFKTAGERGIAAGKIKSIIPLELAAHVRREAEKFIDELTRASSGIA